MSDSTKPVVDLLSGGDGDNEEAAVPPKASADVAKYSIDEDEEYNKLEGKKDMM